MNVYLADDEKIVLEGLKYIIDWNSLGFSICGSAMNGEDALREILSLSPDLVLMDIRMPRMSGIEVVEKCVESGFKGKFIILSGVADFKMAQTAMRNGVDYYLTKPVDEEELEKAVIQVRNQIQKHQKNSDTYTNYRDKAKDTILLDILKGTADTEHMDLDELNLRANLYQVISYQDYNTNLDFQKWDFEKLIRVTNDDNRSFDVIDTGKENVILLKGDFAISQFRRLLAHYDAAPQKGSPLDSVFLVYGQVVSRITDIPLSYNDVVKLSDRRFFCNPGQHVLGFEDPYAVNSDTHSINSRTSQEYAAKFTALIQSHNELQMKELLSGLSDEMCSVIDSIDRIRHTLIDIYIIVKQNVISNYPDSGISFPANATVIDMLEKKYYLYEIMDFLSEQFLMCARFVGSVSGESALSDVCFYIRHNYEKDLKLETIAPLFNYSSPYLGKIFSQKIGMNFNAYLDKVRIEAAKELLKSPNLKVYEVAARVGYKDVNYFHVKFKKYTGTSPAEYRKEIKK